MSDEPAAPIREWHHCPTCRRPVVFVDGVAINHAWRKSRGYVRCAGSGRRLTDEAGRGKP